MQSTKRNTALGRISWGTNFDNPRLIDPWLRLKVDRRYFEVRPKGWYVVRFEDGRVYLRSPRGAGDWTEALIVDYNHRFLNRVELTLLGIPSVSSIYWVGENLVSVTIKSGPVSNPMALLRSLGRRISKSLQGTPHQVAELPEDRYHGKLWVFGSGSYYCQPDRGFVGPDGHSIWISCHNKFAEDGVWTYGGIHHVSVHDATKLVEYKITEDGVVSAKLAVFAGGLSTGFSAEWESVEGEEGLRRARYVWEVVRGRAQGDTHYWYNWKTRRIYGHSDKVLQVLTDAEDFLAKHLPTS